MSTILSLLHPNKKYNFADFVAAQEPSDVEYEILSTVVEGTTAAVKVRDKYLGISFLDTLSLIKKLMINGASTTNYSTLKAINPVRLTELLVKNLNSGLLNQKALLGVTGSNGKTFTIAKVIEKTQRPAIIMAPNKTLAAQLYGEFKDFFPENRVEYFISYYDYYQPEAYVPSSDTYIAKDANINEHIEQMRLSATKALIEAKDTIVVASVSAIYGLGAPESYLKMVLNLSRERLSVKEIF